MDDVYEQVWIRESRKQGMICVCGRIATAEHEYECEVFHGRVNRAYIQELEGKQDNRISDN